MAAPIDIGRLSVLSPGDPDKKIFSCQSGAAAVEAAIKGARMAQYNRLFQNGGSPGRDLGQDRSVGG